jgi:hypothetical protein
MSLRLGLIELGDRGTAGDVAKRVNVNGEWRTVMIIGKEMQRRYFNFSLQSYTRSWLVTPGFKMNFQIFIFL